MHTLIYCPICKNILVSVYRANGTWAKDCLKHLDHKVYTTTLHDNDDELSSLSTLLKNDDLGFYKYVITWRFPTENLMITRRERDFLELPFFIPDLSDWNKLFNKIMTMITFS
jgi:hypothetical protein